MNIDSRKIVNFTINKEKEKECVKVQPPFSGKGPKIPEENRNKKVERKKEEHKTLKLQ